ncbi:MAG: NADH-quinone oxidoreductase subunit B [Bacteroidetes bacterium QS_9_68_14]|nr:MAG: NADH-quinone oxidoreductase subunit B [Bacteroidetes bacterium QS_9_68_14]
MEDVTGGSGYFTTTVNAVTNWARSNSMMPMPMGLACCAIEMMGFAGPRYDSARFGSEAMRFSPRQADLMIVAGWVSYKMSHAIRRVWDQMADPKWCMAMGACASTGGMHRCYGVVQGCDNFLPVDVYIPGCPPRPESVIHGLMDVQEKIRNEYDLVTQDYSVGKASRLSPVRPSNAEFPGELAPEAPSPEFVAPSNPKQPVE